MYCYCNDNELRNATDATCVILNPFTSNDPTWNNFDSQIYLQKLKFVVRTPNGLDYIPVQLLALLKNLQIITIQDASINEIAEYAFSNLPMITDINLSRNSISILRMHAFENMKNLTVLYLSENRITEINRQEHDTQKTKNFILPASLFSLQFLFSQQYIIQSNLHLVIHYSRYSLARIDISNAVEFRPHRSTPFNNSNSYTFIKRDLKKRKKEQD